MDASNPYPAKCVKIAERLARAELLAALERAEINLATWYRWLKGTAEPFGKTWRRFQAELPKRLRDAA